MRTGVMKSEPFRVPGSQFRVHVLSSAFVFRCGGGRTRGGVPEPRIQNTNPEPGTRNPELAKPLMMPRQHRCVTRSPVGAVRAAALAHVRLVLGPEVLDRREHR